MSMNNTSVKIGVAIFIFKNGKFLMGLRKGSHGADTWSVPGGHLELGESFADTAIRETKEETGLFIKNVRFGAITNDFFPQDKKQYISIWMLADHDHGEPTETEPDKYVKQSWFDFDHLPKPLFHPWNQLLPSEFLEEIKRQSQLSKK
jgi:8-oxo-dGTP diphosphatase